MGLPPLRFASRLPTWTMLRMLLHRRIGPRRGPLAVAAASSLGRRPAPPPLPPAQQADFERLQRQAEAAAAAAAAAETDSRSASDAGPDDFSGAVNPRTGEVGGPKKEPLRWGPDGDWSYNGRVTDF